VSQCHACEWVIVLEIRATSTQYKQGNKPGGQGRREATDERASEASVHPPIHRDCG